MFHSFMRKQQKLQQKKQGKEFSFSCSSCPVSALCPEEHCAAWSLAPLQTFAGTQYERDQQTDLN